MNKKSSSFDITEFEISKEDIFNPGQSGVQKWKYSGNCPSSLNTVRRVAAHRDFPKDLGKRITRACSLSRPLYSDTAAAQRSLLFSSEKLESIDTDFEMSNLLDEAAAEMQKETEAVANLRIIDLSDAELGSISTVDDLIQDQIFSGDAGAWTEHIRPTHIPGVSIANVLRQGTSAVSKRIGGAYTGQIGLSMGLQDYWAGRNELDAVPVTFNGYMVEKLIDDVRSGLQKYVSWLLDYDDNKFNPIEYEYTFFTARTLLYALNRMSEDKMKQRAHEETTSEIRADIENDIAEINALMDSLTVPDQKWGDRLLTDFVWATLRMSAHAYNHGKRSAAPREVNNQSDAMSKKIMKELNKVLETVENIDKSVSAERTKSDKDSNMFKDMIFDKCSSIEQQNKKMTESINALTVQVTNVTKTVSQANFMEKAPTVRGDYRTGVTPTVVVKQPEVVPETSAWDDRTDYKEWFKQFQNKHSVIQVEFGLNSRDYETISYICRKNGYEDSPYNISIISLISGKMPSVPLSRTIRSFLEEAENISGKERYKWGLDILGDISPGAKPKRATMKPPAVVSRTVSGTKITDSIWDH